MAQIPIFTDGGTHGNHWSLWEMLDEYFHFSMMEYHQEKLVAHGFPKPSTGKQVFSRSRIIFRRKFTPNPASRSALRPYGPALARPSPFPGPGLSPLFSIHNMATILIFTDGGARGNPGPAGAGAVIYKDDAKVAEISEYLGDHLTNNWAEYEALILALTAAKKHGLAGQDIEVRMDSELIVKQMKGEYRVKDAAMKQQYMKVHNLLIPDFPNTRFVHIPRAENSEADALVNRAIDAAL